VFGEAVGEEGCGVGEGFGEVVGEGVAQGVGVDVALQPGGDGAGDAADVRLGEDHAGFVAAQAGEEVGGGAVPFHVVELRSGQLCAGVGARVCRRRGVLGGRL
jgi:hypothetical protein